MGNRGAALAVAGPLVAFKLFAMVLLLHFSPTGGAVALAIAAHWPWALLIVLFAAAPLLAWLRLVRVRARRAELRRSEWMVDPLDCPADGRDLPVRRQWPLWETVSRVERES